MADSSAPSAARMSARLMAGIGRAGRGATVRAVGARGLLGGTGAGTAGLEEEAGGRAGVAHKMAASG